MRRTKLNQVNVERVPAIVENGHSITIFGCGNIYLADNDREIANKKTLSSQIDVFKLFATFKPGDKLPTNVGELEEAMLTQASREQFARVEPEKSKTINLSDLTKKTDELKIEKVSFKK